MENWQMQSIRLGREVIRAVFPGSHNDP